MFFWHNRGRLLVADFVEEVGWPNCSRWCEEPAAREFFGAQAGIGGGISFARERIDL
jgi:hypothetical protein